jgi:hypothetical protein
MSFAGRQPQNEFIRQSFRARDARAAIRQIVNDAIHPVPSIARFDMGGSLPFHPEIVSALARHLFSLRVFKGAPIPLGSRKRDVKPKRKMPSVALVLCRRGAMDRRRSPPFFRKVKNIERILSIAGERTPV